MSRRKRSSVLDLFLPPVRNWFRDRMGDPTPAQEQGWPAIANGENTLILAPTGSGKTLAAFLACLDNLWRQNPLPEGVQVLYISPLKALNNDIYRNLQVPLQEVTQLVENRYSLPSIKSAVRTGDTPSSERQKMIRKPPHILITTPESLNLMLTSQAREILRGVKYCIVDEIHSLCPNKRGVFLSLLLERLQALNPQGFVRIGLSATQRPLDEVARYLGGLRQTQHAYEPRPVTIIDAGFRKKLDLKVISPVPEFGPLDERSVWPSIYRYLYQEIDQHQSTIVFANDRSRVERITLTLNDLHQEQKKGEVEEEETPLALSHHGSVSLEARRSTEQALKDGELKAVIATGSLEMGIDMGAVDLVCQVASPGTVARGLQRVGRAGHLVGKASKGRMIPRTLADLLDQAALAREMIAGRVEECRIPSNCLDILAQQIIAMVAMDNWQIPDLLNVVRRAYPYRNLTPAALETVLEMVTGRYRFDPPTNSEVPANKPAGTLTSLQPKISWDRVHNQLKALPGSKQLALLQGGTIPDTGQYAVFSTSDVRIGELDEEFVFERRVGEVFLLGTNTWQIDQIGQDRVVVKPVTGSSAVFPFWRGEGAGRSYELGQAIGKSLKEMEKRLDKEDCLKWMEKQFHLDEPSALNLQRYLRKQMDKAGCLPNDKTIYVEASRDQLGDWQLQIFCPLGRQINLGLKLAIEANLKSRLKFRPQGFHHDDGVLIRLLDMEEPILDVFDGITPENVQKMIIDDLIDTPLFSLRFRQNATRALLMPRGGAGKRAPLWLQRLRGRDLLQVARRHPDFPIVVETYRECLEDYLHLPKLLQLFEEIATGKTRVIAKQLETPSPFASVLQLSFTMVNMYDLDSTEPDSGNSANLDSRLLEQLLAPQNPEVLLDHRAIHLVNQRLRGVGQPPRSSAEMAEWLRKLGDLTQEEVDGLKVGYLQELEQEGVAKVINISANGKKSSRWILTEEENLYGNAFRNSKKREPEWEKAAEHILHRYLGTHALVTLEEILARYPFPQQWTRQKLADWTRQGNLVSVEPRSGTQALQWSSPQILRQVQRSSLGILRRETVTATPAQFTDFLIRHQHLHPDCGLGDASGVAEVLHKLQGLGLPTELWERVILPARMPAYQTRWLDDQLDSGRWLWFCQGDVDSRVELLSFIEREKVSVYSPISSEEKISSEAEAVWECLQKRGALFALDLAQETKLNLLRVRKALWKLLRLGLVTNDRFDVLRRKEQFLEGISDTEVVTSRRQRTRRLAPPDGRWSVIHWGNPTAEKQAVHAANVLLDRYGVVARELAGQDPALPPWRVLYQIYDRMELSGEVRRGYFIEGLTGTQFALPEEAKKLQTLVTHEAEPGKPILIHSLDPANLYGAGAPFVIPWMEKDSRSFLRRTGNWLVICAGQPVLLIEQQGKRLTAFPSVGTDQLTLAVQTLPTLLEYERRFSTRHKLTVHEWNDQPVVATQGKELLETVGFVSDYQAMTLYAGWK